MTLQLGGVDVNLPAILDKLARVRPIFHSEADFQFALAWGLGQVHQSVKTRLETRPREWATLVSEELGLLRASLDIEVTSGEARLGIEVKYLKKPNWSKEYEGELFAFGNGVVDHSRYDVIRDVVRIERYVESGPQRSGAVIVLASNPVFWNSPRASDRERVDDSFGIHQGQRLSGARSWAAHAGAGTIKGRSTPLDVRGEYDIAWVNYSKEPLEHRALIIEMPASS